jgi:phosphoribosylanthranilate isomerase
MTRLKFCGLTRPEDASHAASVGATYAGVILTESVRQVSPGRALEILAAAPNLKRVGVFRHDQPASILADATAIGLDVLQLHGRFTAETVDQLREGFDGEMWAVIPFDASEPRLPDSWSELADRVDAILVDTSVGGRSGGTGATFDWIRAEPLVRKLAERTEVVLAGGLTPMNVGEAIRTLGPGVVDVSSGVESVPGVKDHHLMKAFAEAVRSASIV